VLAANAVATRDIDEYTIAGGVPARPLRSRLPVPELRVEAPARPARPARFAPGATPAGP
jgi:acetyltransferase-like isoleucine patch superfamily enzyme